MKNAILVFLILSYFESTAQRQDVSLIDLSVLNDTVSCTSANCSVLLEYSIKNISDNNLILYHLASKASDSPFGPGHIFCDEEKTGAGIVFFLFDDNMHWKSRTHMIKSDYSRPLTTQRADSSMSIAKGNFLKSTVILMRKETKTLVQELDLTTFNLPKGCYYIRLLYYAGSKIDLFVSNEQMRNHTTSHDAKVYQGCVNSNKVLLIVN